MISESILPPMPLDEWIETKRTLHLYLQIIGKIKLKLMPYKNHWWSAALYINTIGIGTMPLPYSDKLIEFNFDFCRHKLIISSNQEEVHYIELKDSLCVSEFYRQVFEILGKMNVEAKILAKPYEFETTTPFAEDVQHCTYQRNKVHRFWQILSYIDPIFKEFSGKFIGKCSPVHLFWHSFDLAVTRFSGRKGPEMPDANKVNKEAYSHEVISAGFWFGDKNVPEAAFYSYTYPAPKDLNKQPLLPAGKAGWIDSNGSPMALYKYADFRTAAEPKASLLEFLESSYKAGAKLADWDTKALECES